MAAVPAGVVPPQLLVGTESSDDAAVYQINATQALVEQAALANGVSKSRWVADLIRKHAGQEWPRECLDMAGRFADFPLREEPVAAGVADVARVGF